MEVESGRRFRIAQHDMSWIGVASDSMFIVIDC